MLHEQVCPKCYGYMLNDQLGWLRCLSCSFMKKRNDSMISIKEILKDVKQEDLSQELKDNLLELQRRVNLFRAEYANPMYVNSGYRTEAHNREIGGAPGSAHLSCQAIDFRDNDGKIKGFIEHDSDVLERCDLWMEDPDLTPTWVHLQIRPIKSGNRVFKS